MPCVVIVNQTEGIRVFDLQPGKTIIGRGEDANLMLPNVSVSRHHAQIIWDGAEASIEDLNSSNGTYINGTRVNGSTLKSDDIIVLGKFTLVYKGDGPLDRFYKGRYLEYMLKHDAPTPFFEDSTFAMTPAQIKQMQAEGDKMRNARLTSTVNQSRFWHPEDRKLTFGDGGMVDVEGMFSGGVVADICWDGKHHLLTKRGRLIGVSINESAVTESPLRNGDRVQIGKTQFLYEYGQQ
jgi:pSer/pThr/pTyr-binding forkhead associated (FHA) protein